MKKNLLLLLMMLVLSVNAQSEYSTCGPNLVSNGTFSGATNNETSVPDWVFTPPGNKHGWKKAKTLIYGDYIIINRIGKYTASPVKMELKEKGAKLIKFRFNTSGTGPFNYTVSIGDQKLVTFKENGGWAQAYMTVEPGVEATLNREYLSEKRFDINNVNGSTVTPPQQVSNNIWHEVMLYLPNYQGGEKDLKFTYERSSGILRQVMLDDVEVYEAIPKPEINKKEYTVGENNKFDLGSIDITNKANYEVKWYTSNGVLVNSINEASAGSYYAVFASNGCEGPKTYINVYGKGCGANIIKNGIFENPVLSNNRNGGNSKMNVAQKVISIPNWSFTPGEYTAISVGNYYGASSVLGLDSGNNTLAKLSQEIDICSGVKYRLSFDFAMSIFSWVGQNRNVIFKVGGVQIFKIGIKNRGWDPDEVAVHTVNYKVASNFEIDNKPYTPSTNDLPNALAGDYSRSSVLQKEKFYHLEVDLNMDEVKDRKIEIEVNQGAIPYFGNFGLVSKGINPLKTELTTKSSSVDCVTGVYDLNDATPQAKDGLRYIWYYDQEMKNAIPQGENGKIEVGPGTYYMQTISDCSGCKSETATAFTVNSGNCSKVTGTVYNDYDGNSNGINSGKPFSGGLYAVLLDNAGRVVNSQKVTPDGSEKGPGTYSIFATPANGYYVVLSDKKPEIGTPASDLTIGQIYAYTGETVNGGNINTKVGTESSKFNLSSNGTAVVNFGIGVRPIAGDVGQRFCHSDDNVDYVVPDLVGVSGDENFNEGKGQTVIISSVETTPGGELLYNGEKIDSQKEIQNYEPSKLKYKITDTSKEYNLEFKYKWRDKSGLESPEAGTATITVAAKLDGEISAEHTIIKDCSNQKVKITLTGKNGASPYTFTYSINGERKTAKTNSGEDSVTIEENATTGTYAFKLIDVQDYMKCQAEVSGKDTNVFVNCGGGKVKCFKSPASGEGVNPTLVLISTLQTNNDWVNKSKNGFIKMESKNKGFVITRLTNEQIKSVKNPLEGMLVWSTTDNCLKMYTDNEWSCLSQGCNE
ncbi:hypothetical protein [Ornithobacterium rhinotracheale]